MYHVLIVDDEKAERQGLVFLLRAKAYPFVIYEASDNEDAMKTAELLHRNRHPLDLLITDIRSPFVDGFTLNSNILKNFPNLITIISSAHTDFRHTQAAIRTHVFDYIPKPVIPDEFYEAIDCALLKLDQLAQSRDQTSCDSRDSTVFQTDCISPGCKSSSEENDSTLLPSSTDNTAVSKVIHLIEENYSSPISLKWLSNQVYLSECYLSNIFKKTTGMNITQYLFLCRMREAEKLLRNTTMKVIDIGKAVGYTNNSYFGQQFKQHFGVSPQALRENSHQ